MNRISRLLTYLTIITFPIDLVRIINPSISFFRIFLILALFATILSSVANGNSARTRTDKVLLMFMIISVFGMLVAKLVSKDQEYASSAFLNDASGLILILIVYVNFENKDINFLLKVFVLSQLAVIPFSCLSIAYFGHASSVPDSISFGGMFFLQFDKVQLVESSQNLRLFLPYSNATVLSVTMASCVMLLLFSGKKIVKNRIIKLALIVLYSVFMIFSQSRTGFVAIFILMAVFCVYMSFVKNKVSYIAKFLIGLSFAILVVVAIANFSENQIIARFVSRVVNESSESVSSNRHYLVPLEGLNVWISSVKNFLVGIGYGGNMYLTPKWTYLPNNSFLNSFVTVVVQKGAFGLAIVIFWLKILFQNLKQARKTDSYYVFLCFFLMLISCLFYELYQCSTFWILFAYAFLPIKIQKGGQYENCANWNIPAPHRWDIHPYNEIKGKTN